MSPQPPYMPTLEEIAEGCREIQKGWAEEDYRMRSGCDTKLAARASLQWRPDVVTEDQIQEMFGRRRLSE